MNHVQSSRDLVSVEPGRSELLERRLRPAAHGHTCALQDFNARIHDGTLYRSEIRRGRNPLDACALEKIITMPVPHRNDMQVRAYVIFSVEKLRELPDGEAVAHWYRKISHETGLVRIQYRAFDHLSA